MRSVAEATRSDTRPAGRASARSQDLESRRATDREIVDGLRGREHEALERMMEEYGGLIAHWAQVAGGEADDVTQDVVLKVWRAADRLEPDTFLPGLLKTVTQNTVRNRWRTESRKPSLPSGLQVEPRRPSDPIGATTERIAIEQVLDTLQPRERECLSLLYLSDLPLHTVAQRLGVSEQATKSLAARARRRLRQALETGGARPGEGEAWRVAG